MSRGLEIVECNDGINQTCQTEGFSLRFLWLPSSCHWLMMTACTALTFFIHSTQRPPPLDANLEYVYIT